MENLELLKVGVGRMVFGKGAIHDLPDEILRFGNKAMLVAGEHTTSLIKEALGTELEDKGIEATWVYRNETNSMDYAQRLAEKMNAEGINVIVAIGGGRCMDLCKVARDLAGRAFVITVPTAIATCAATSAVSIMYTKDESRYDLSYANHKEVDCCIADVDIIGKAPKRLLAAGILDSIAKLPETVNGRTDLVYPTISLHKYVAYNNSCFIYDFLTKYGVEIYNDPFADEQKLSDVILINLIITSIVSGFSKGSDQLAVAHGLYDGCKKLFPVETRNALHGEIVAVGVLMQMIFNGDSEEEYNKIYNMMKAMNMPMTLQDIGLNPTEKVLATLKAYNAEKNNMSEADIAKLDNAFSAVI